MVRSKTKGTTEVESLRHNDKRKGLESAPQGLRTIRLGISFYLFARRASAAAA